MAPFPDRSVPRPGRREVTSLGPTWGWGPLAAGGWGTGARATLGWDSFQEARVLDTHFLCRAERAGTLCSYTLTRARLRWGRGDQHGDPTQVCAGSLP